MSSDQWISELANVSRIRSNSPRMLKEMRMILKTIASIENVQKYLVMIMFVPPPPSPPPRAKLAYTFLYNGLKFGVKYCIGHN